MVKVGDKVRYNGIGGSNGVLKKGNVYDVIALSTTMKDWVYVRSDKESHYDGSNASEKIAQPFTYLANSQYEGVKEMPKAEIKPGDKVKLIDKFYEHEAFKKLVRFHRKDIANQSGKELKILEIDCGKVRYSAKDDGWYVIPVELLEKVEELPKIPKPGDLFRVIGNDGDHYYSVGDIVEFIKIHTSMGMYLLKGYSKRRNEVCNQVLYKSDIEPYTKHRYTAEQIAEAQRIIGEIVADFPNGVSVNFRKEGVKTYTYVGGVNFDRFATCNKTDEFNQTIGRMIALCKQVRRPLPEWL